MCLAGIFYDWSSTFGDNSTVVLSRRAIIHSMDEDQTRDSAPERDTVRHSLTIRQASQLFAELGVPRAPRSVQRFCEHGYLDCVRVKGAKGDQFFVNRQSVERYAE